MLGCEGVKMKKGVGGNIAWYKVLDGNERSGDIPCFVL